MISGDMIPHEIAYAWRHCGLIVRGAWVKEGEFKGEGVSLGEEHWRLFAVERGSIETSFAVGDIRANEGEMMLSGPGASAVLHMAAGSKIIDIRFSAISEIGFKVPWSMINLPLVVPGLIEQDLLDLAERMKDDRWCDLNAAMKARFVVDQTLFQMVKYGFAAGLLSAQTGPQWLNDAIVAADEELKNPDFQVEAFSKLAGCTKEHLNRTIRKYRDCTASELLKNLRIQRAEHMLKHDKNIDTESVAQRCGYTNLQTFGKHWRSVMGCGLREFRSNR